MSLSVTEVMEVIDGYSARDLEVLQVYIQKIRDEWAKGKRGKRVHGLNWSQEARRVLLLGLQVPTIETCRHLVCGTFARLMSLVTVAMSRLYGLRLLLSSRSWSASASTRS